MTHMVNKITIMESVIHQIKKSIKYCSNGNLLGFYEKTAGVVNILEALPLAVPGNGGYKKIGLWGTALNHAPAFPRTDEIFLHVDPETLDVRMHKILSQSLESIKDFEIIKTSSDLFNRIRGIFDTTKVFQKKVAVVGIGSVGGLITLELAKSGVGQFLLYDPDILSIGNISRHIGDLKDLGKYKTRIMAEKVLSRNPDVLVRTSEKNILSIDEDDLKKDWKGVDLIIAATDSQEATYLLNQVSLDLNIPILWIGLYEKASWGHILFSIPNETPCLVCVLPDLAKIGNQVPREERIIDYSSVTDISQVKSEPGLGSDVGYVAMAASKIGLALLLKDNSTSTLQEILSPDKNLLLVANSPGSIFPNTEAFRTHWAKTSIKEDCEECQKERQAIKKYGKQISDLRQDVQNLVSHLPEFSGINTKDCITVKGENA